MIRLKACTTSCLETDFNFGLGCWREGDQIRNPKHEIRNKSESPKLKIQNTLQHQNIEVENGSDGGLRTRIVECLPTCGTGKSLAVPVTYLPRPPVLELRLWRSESGVAVTPLVGRLRKVCFISSPQPYCGVTFLVWGFSLLRGQSVFEPIDRFTKVRVRRVL